jgi:hypothetical protein
VIDAARGVLKAGLGHDDVRAAIDQVRTALADEARFAWVAPRERRRRWQAAGLVLIAMAAVAAVLLAATGLRLEAPLLLAVVGLVVLGGAKLMDLAEWASRRSLPSWAAGVGLSLLRGPCGRWLFRGAATGLREDRQTVPPAAQPTEVFLGDAVEALYDALPNGIRRRFDSVPEAVDRLERDAARLRERDRALAEALARVASDHAAGAVPERRHAAASELAAARAAVQSRLSTAVAALESIRLDLLRLQAGVGSMDDLTDDLEKAREINAAVDAELAGREAVRELTGSSAS